MVPREVGELVDELFRAVGTGLQARPQRVVEGPGRQGVLPDSGIAHQWDDLMGEPPVQVVAHGPRELTHVRAFPYSRAGRQPAQKVGGLRESGHIPFCGHRRDLFQPDTGRFLVEVEYPDGSRHP